MQCTSKRKRVRFASDLPTLKDFQTPIADHKETSVRAVNQESPVSNIMSYDDDLDVDVADDSPMACCVMQSYWDDLDFDIADIDHTWNSSCVV